MMPSLCARLPIDICSFVFLVIINAGRVQCKPQLYGRNSSEWILSTGVWSLFSTGTSAVVGRFDQCNRC